MNIDVNALQALPEMPIVGGLLPKCPSITVRVCGWVTCSQGISCVVTRGYTRES